MRMKRHDQAHELLREELKRIREHAGPDGEKISQEKLAENLGTKQSFISKYEKGERNLDFIEVLQVLRALNHDPADLIKKLGV